MLGNLPQATLQNLMRSDDFKEFLLAAIQSGGVLSQSVHATGSAGRDLYHEGRRDFALEMLQTVDLALPEPMQSGDALQTLLILLNHQANKPQPKPRKVENERFTDE